VSAKYLLPCRCGQNVVVEPRQAGETTVCSCGQSLPIPTYLEMTALEPAPDEPVAPVPGSTWGWRQQMVLVGIVLLSAAVAVGILAYTSRPITPIEVFDLNKSQVEENAKNLSPVKTWLFWNNMKQVGLIRHTNPKYEAAMVVFRVEQTVAVALALAGLALIGIGGRKKKGAMQSAEVGTSKIN
jgi:hypothetical protein